MKTSSVAALLGVTLSLLSCDKKRDSKSGWQELREICIECGCIRKTWTEFGSSSVVVEPTGLTRWHERRRPEPHTHPWGHISRYTGESGNLSNPAQCACGSDPLYQQIERVVMALQELEPLNLDMPLHELMARHERRWDAIRAATLCPRDRTEIQRWWSNLQAYLDDPASKSTPFEKYSPKR